MAIKDWNGFKKSGDTYIPNDATARAGVTATVDLLKDTTGWTGKNHFDNKQAVADRTQTTNRTITDTGVRITNTEATAYGYVRYNLGLSANTDYTISSKITRNAGVCHIMIRGSADDTTYTTLLEKTYNTGDIEDTFNTGNNTYIRLYLYCSLAESVVGDITYDELMISDAYVYKLSPTYEPYHESVELSKYNRSEANILGAKNLFPIDLNTLKAKNTTGIWADNVYTLNKAEFTCTVENGFVTKITVNSDGAITGNTNFILFDGNNSVDLVKKLKGKELTLNGCPSGGSSTTYRMLFSTWSSAENKYDNGEGCTVDVPNNVAGMRFDIIMYSGYTANNKEFYPMLRLATDTDSDFAPYAMTNRELTEKVNDITPKLLPSGSNLNNYITEGDYFAGADTYDNCPFSNTAFRLKVLPFNNPATRCIQIIYANKPDPEVYMRTNFGGTWQSWYKFTGTVVS